jgi:serine/threonine protein kinase
VPFQATDGSTLSPYRLTRLLGRGGMGEVYLAQDTRLDRRVALKLLSAQFAKDAERILRFTQEARAASALNHPNIITIYDIGESGDVPYIATEFIDGQTRRSVRTLRHRPQGSRRRPANRQHRSLLYRHTWTGLESRRQTRLCCQVRRRDGPVDQGGQ